MNTGRTILLLAVFAAVLAVILLTWGSVGSAILTLGLIIGVLFIALKKSLSRDPKDFDWEG